MQVYGYKRNNIGASLYMLLSISTFGIFPLICFWKPLLFVILARQKTELSVAELIGIHDEGSYSEANVSIVTIDNKEMKYFEYKKQRYVIETNKFVPLAAQMSGSCQEMVRKGAITSQEAKELLTKYGYNTLDIEEKPISKLIAAKISHPFYIFQSLSVFIWIRTGNY